MLMLREMLKRHEGLSLKPYLCSRVHMTIGWGWNLDAHALPVDIAACLRVTGSITEAMAERLLNISITNATDDCRAIYPGFDKLSEPRRFGLIDFMFNLGVTKILHKFPAFYSAACHHDWNRAADEMQYTDGLKKDQLSDYWKQTKGRAVEIVGMIREG